MKRTCRDKKNKGVKTEKNGFTVMSTERQADSPHIRVIVDAPLRQKQKANFVLIQEYCGNKSGAPRMKLRNEHRLIIPYTGL